MIFFQDPGWVGTTSAILAPPPPPPPLYTSRCVAGNTNEWHKSHAMQWKSSSPAKGGLELSPILKVHCHFVQKQM